MTSAIEEKELQERLREASALGDIEEVQRLVEFGVSVNSQNEINGWTCLHWACKRNHAQVVSFLLDAGADKDILTVKEERPVQLTSKREIRKMLGVEDADELLDEKKDSALPIIPNYLANPPFPYVYNSMSSSTTSTSASSLNGRLSPSLEQHNEDSTVSLSQVQAAGTAMIQHDIPSPVGSDGNMRRASTVECPEPVVQNGHSGQMPVPPSRILSSPAASKQPETQQQNGSSAGPVATFQPFFFTGAFPFSNMQELVLKVRVQNRTLKENDFIEIELDRQELTYKELLRVSCCELGVNPEHVEKIRKLPNTVLRKDKDVARLQDFQELELVLMISDNDFLFRNAAPTLTERPCYNKKASKLTY
ncbi:ankyrin repeat domain-containing protein 40-like [Hemicordylus capensis]|uniref:ankyrin repeat domain-containing protein 40-like n=1 Tax=Hemicordylus capensis TaxID=884348 RepID=UPI00230484D6|nr:ankyrin repeat domain-containing protein 40-like [Hemicordylus capensis]XP_053157757.1 ankyrin repeat domain-containing protein 40-like [Hemicordylus capensis]XP_053157758.1 ankyrin repeat domain-containing protein 40-like [Hemicordylus capensis]